MRRSGKLVSLVITLVALGLVSAWFSGAQGGPVLASDPAATTVQVLPGQGVVFDQVDFLFPEATVPDSDWGRVSADPEELFASTGLPRGYINIYTDAGWVVANLLADQSYGLEPVTTYFTLGLPAPEDVSVLSAYVEFSSTPRATFADGPRSDFPVGAAGWNAEGAGELRTTSVGPAPPPFGVIVGSPPDEKHVQPNPVNVEAAVNQCFPMAIANSLQYLENRFGVNIFHDHKPGLKGDNSLVGHLDMKANRRAPARDDGDGVWFVPMLLGKFDYLSQIGLQGRLVHKHQGRGYGDPNANQALKAGNFWHKGSVSRDDGPRVTWEWVCNEIKEGEDVELVFSYDDAAGNPTGGHAVRIFGCGITDGKRWLRYLHDAVQSDDSRGLETADAYVRDMDGDGILNFGAANREIRFALSESAPPGVGGVTEFLGGSTDSPAGLVDDSSFSPASYAAIAAAAAALVFVIAGYGWRARKRWQRRR